MMLLLLLLTKIDGQSLLILSENQRRLPTMMILCRLRLNVSVLNLMNLVLLLL